MHPAQLQESTQTNGPPPGLTRASAVVSSDITRLATTDPIGEVELQPMYKKMLQNIFQSNLESLSTDMIRATFDLAANAYNRSTLQQYWHNDWDWASSLLKDDKVIRSHCLHHTLSALDIQSFAHIMHKHCTVGKGDKMQVRQLLPADVSNRSKMNSFASKCITSNVPWLLRDAFLIDANALIMMQHTARTFRTFNETLNRPAKPAHTDPTTWSNDRYFDNYTELYPDSSTGGTANTANAGVQALKEGRAFCQLMEDAVVTRLEDCSSRVTEALRSKLTRTYPDALYQGRPEAIALVRTIKQEFQRMAIEPAKYKHAAKYV